MSVAIAGYGVLTPFGGVEETFAGLRAGKSVLAERRIAGVKGAWKCTGGFISFEQETLQRHPEYSPNTEPFALLARIAAADAWHHAGSHVAGISPDRIGVVIGSANAGKFNLEKAYHRYFGLKKRVSPRTIPFSMGCLASTQVADLIGANGPVMGISSACASSNHAIKIAMDLLNSKSVDAVVCGGSDYSNIDSYLHGWDSLGMISSTRIRPFCKYRDGTMLGDGAGILVLIRQEDVCIKLPIVMGIGFSQDTDGITSNTSKKMASAMISAIRAADLNPEDIDYVNAHGTGTVQNDAEEIAALNSVFSNQVRVTSTKSDLGHTLGASGAIEIILSLEMMNKNFLIGQKNVIDTEESIKNFLVTESQGIKISTALSNSFAFGGMNTSIVFGCT